MAWNPSPKVAEARDFAEKYGAKMVVILYVTEQDQLGYASYGLNKRLCDKAKELADTAFDAITEE